MTTEITIFDPIGLDPETGAGMTAKAFNDQFRGASGAILLRINSPGGDVMEAMAIYTMIRASRANVTARIEGIAASAASLIAMAADRIEIAPNAFLLIHHPWTQATGSADDLSSAADDLARLSSQYVGIYADRSGQPKSAVRALMAEDRLMTADEAVSLGYADCLADISGAAPNMSGLPKRHRAIIRAARRDGSHGWNAAIAKMKGEKRGSPLRPGREIEASWDAALKLMETQDRRVGRRPAAHTSFSSRR